MSFKDRAFLHIASACCLAVLCSSLAIGTATAGFA